MQFGIEENILVQIIATLRSFNEIEDAIIYGSRAKGNFKTGSDIDLTLKGKALNLNILTKIELALEELYLPYSFDISIYHHISNSDLIAHIQRIGKSIFLH